MQIGDYRGLVISDCKTRIINNLKSTIVDFEINPQSAISNVQC
jgi:hypothetical protein